MKTNKQIIEEEKKEIINIVTKHLTPQGMLRFALSIIYVTKHLTPQGMLRFALSIIYLTEDIFDYKNKKLQKQREEIIELLKGQRYSREDLIKKLEGKI
jgi:hypothetical protein